MLRLAIVLCFVSSAAFAQASPPSASPDPADTIATYRQLLSEANDRIAALSAQVQANARAAAAARAEHKPPSDAIGVPSPEGGVRMKMQEPKK